jgi:hypothetical protein
VLLLDLSTGNAAASEFKTTSNTIEYLLTAYSASCNDTGLNAAAASTQKYFGTAVAVDEISADAAVV